MQSSKKAILIGINYFNTESELHGCQNDIDTMSIILKNFGFKEKDIVILKDERDDTHYKNQNCPTRVNTIKQIKKTVKSMKSGDILYIHYSGHGSWTIDKNFDEKDGKDEMICCVDNTNIIDDELNELLVKNLPTGVILRCLFDSCHSGSVLDLPYEWSYGNTFSIENVREISKEFTGKDCLMISGCKDYQTSADAYISTTYKNSYNGKTQSSKYQGAMTWGFVETLKHFKIINDDLSKNNNIDHVPLWNDIINHLRNVLKNSEYTQIPQISMSDKKYLGKFFDLI